MIRNSILVILGPTASGKSDLAVKLAKKFNGEIISADSRQVYRGLNIGAGKITKKEMRKIPHWLLDVANPKKRFTVAEYQKQARQKISEILSRGHLPIICGGTGFYIQSVVDNVVLPNVPPNEKLRAELRQKSAPELFLMLQKIDPLRASKIDRQNPRRLIRAIEISLYLNSPFLKGSGESAPPAPKRLRRAGSRGIYLPFVKGALPSSAGGISENPPPTAHPLRKDEFTDFQFLQIGIKFPPAELRRRIHIRLFARLPVRSPSAKVGMSRGMLAEAKKLHTNGLSWKRMEELGLEYRYLARFLSCHSRAPSPLPRGLDISPRAGEMGNPVLTKEQMLRKLETEIWRYARRQMTWFRRDKRIKWFSPADFPKIEKEIKKFLRQKMS